MARREMSDSAAAGLLVGAIGLCAGVGRLFDNSFLTHLSTGRLIWNGDGFPRVDPYTFTAAGDEWYAQSWLASVLYGGLDELGGGAAIRVHFALTTAVLAVLGWALTRPAGHVVRRLVALAPFLAVGVFGWGHRPLLIGFACLAATLLVAEGSLDRRWLVPVGWIWLNAHGSWPLGLAALAALWVGRALDREPATAERSAVLWLGGGLLAGCLNPYGPRLLAFPLVAVERRELFSQVEEWGAPSFQRPGDLAFLGAVALAVVSLRLRPAWRTVVPLVAFTAAALVSQRNIAAATIVLLPVTARGLAGEGRVVPPLLVRAAPALAVAVAAIGLVVATRPPAFDEGLYPVAAMRWLADEGLAPDEARVITQDFVGNWVGWRLGPGPFVFIDDRYELVPDAVAEDYIDLLRGRPQWQGVLDAYEPDAVVWQAELPLASLLEASECWDVPYGDDDYVVAVPAAGAGCP